MPRKLTWARGAAKLVSGIAVSVLALMPFGAQAQDEAAGLSVGDAAPDFTLTGSDGKEYSLSQFKGEKPVILAFFPKSFTPG